MHSGPRSAPIVAAGMLLGCGLGGFLDGILLHQLLQWHNMLSSVRPPLDLLSMKYNMLWDGIFHALTWLLTAAGVARLWRAGGEANVRWSAAVFVGSLLIGWGLFNFIEGLLDHLLFGIHHVRPGEAELAWDLAFQASGVLLVGGGFWLLRRGLASGVT
jgi:uncharacterized membrane protein